MEWFVATPLNEFVESNNERLPHFELCEYHQGEILPGFPVMKHEYFMLDHIWAGGASHHEDNQYYRTNVCVFQCIETNKKVVVKITPFTESDEVSMIEHINRKKRHLIENQIFVDVHIGHKATLARSRAQTLKPVNYNFIIMEHGGKTLHSVRNSLSSDKKIKILEKIARMSETLLKNNLCYMDMKPTNIVYQEDTDVVKFIDFGGVNFSNDKNTCATYPVHTHISGRDLLAHENAVVYGVGALYAIFVELENEFPFRFFECPASLSSNEKNRLELEASKNLVEHIKSLVDEKENIMVRILYKNTLLFQNNLSDIIKMLQKISLDYQ